MYLIRLVCIILATIFALDVNLIRDFLWQIEFSCLLVSLNLNLLGTGYENVNGNIECQSALGGPFYFSLNHGQSPMYREKLRSLSEHTYSISRLFSFHTIFVHNNLNFQKVEPLQLQ